MCLCMAATLLTAACGKEEVEKADENKGNVQAEVTAEPTKAPAPVGEALPEAKYYFSFDEADGTDKFQPSMKDSASTPIVQPAPSKEVMLIDGVKGQALYCNGTYGYKIPEINGVGETYSISFWVYARRFANYMPTIQFGPDMHGDATGGQHYLNFTRAEWSGEGEYPCIWSYNQKGSEASNWPNWSPDDEQGERLNQWLNVTFVVDENRKTEEGSNLLAKMYLNGQLFGEEITIVNGTMAPSDNFDFLLGINYWDAYFKGGFDELYIFDQVLTEGQVQTLYQAGDPKAKFVEPERVIVVTPEEKAIDSIGKIELKNDWGSEWFTGVEIKDGETKKVKLHNWSSGLASTDNYGIVFSNVPSAADVDPKTVENYKEYALVRADATGESYVDAQYNYTWGNWKTWTQSAMVDARVTLTISREGDTLKVVANNVDFNETSNDMTAVMKTTLTATDPCYFAITCQNSYVDLLSVKDATPRENEGLTVGTQDCTIDFWKAFSPIWSVPVGESRTFGFTNYTSGSDLWNNFVTILQSTPEGHSAETAGYKEYGVVRADNWGWGDGFNNDLPENKSCDWNWETFKEDMDGAHISLTVTNNGSTAQVDIVARNTANVEYHQSYKNIAVDGDLYVTFTCDHSYMVFDSEVLGDRNMSTPFWKVFHDVMSVPKNGSKSVSFTNYTNGENNWENFIVILQNTPGGHAAKTEETVEGEKDYKEYAVFRADNYGWGDGYEATTATCDWNWETFKEDINGAHIDLTVYNEGETADVIIRATTTEGKVYHQSYTGVPVDGDHLYLSLTLEKSYLVFDTNVIGAVDNTTPFWKQFSPVNQIKNGETEHVSFTNHTDGGENWNNFLIVVQSTPTGHGAETEGYKEYGVLRADNYGWSDGYDGDSASSDWNWDTFKDDIDGAHVEAALTNTDGIIDIVITATTISGKVYHQKYKVTAEADSAYYSLLTEKGHISID